MSSDPIEVLRELVNKWRDEAGPVDQIYRLLLLEQSGALATHGCADELESALASLSAPKPESAEAVGDRQAWYEAEIDKAERQWIDGFSRRYEAGDDVPSMSSFVALWLAERTAPPRPEASEVEKTAVAWWGQVCDALSEADPDWMLDGPGGIESAVAMIRKLAAPQQASAPVGVEGLPRFGFPKGDEPRPVPCADGYWAPWHLAQQPAADPLVEWANSPLNFTATVGVFKDGVFKDGVQPAAVDEAVAGWIADGDTIPGHLIEATREAIMLEFGNNGTDGYYKRILVRIFTALAGQQQRGPQE